jgi:hypothetical protein
MPPCSSMIELHGVRQSGTARQAVFSAQAKIARQPASATQACIGHEQAPQPHCTHSGWKLVSAAAQLD